MVETVQDLQPKAQRHQQRRDQPPTATMQSLLAFSVMIIAVTGQFIERDDIGIYDGHLYGIDDIHHDHYQGLRSGLGIAGVGGVGLVGGGAVVAGGGVRIGNQMGLRRCQRGTCMRHPIPPQCKYVPVFRDVSGMFCRGCAENICIGGPLRMGGVVGMGGVRGMGGAGGKGGRRAINKRLRKIRRRICRSTGMCFGDARGPIGMGGVGMMGGIGAIGGVRPMGGLGALVGGGRHGYGSVVG